MSGSDLPDDPDTVREVVERSQSGAPAVGKTVRDRFSSDEVFQRIIAAADHEVNTEGRELFFSGVAGGFAISITFLLYASMSASTDSKLVGALLYPLGFIYIIIGGYQLYTENTLPPVALTLERLASIPTLLRHWLIVLVGNFAGGAVGAIVLRWGGVFEPTTAEYAIDIARAGAFETPWVALFYKGVFAGLIVAGVVWVGFASRDTISRVVVVYLAFLAVPMGDLFHVVVSFTEAIFLMLYGELGVLYGLTNFVLPVLAGNTIGGVVLVTVINYYQTSENRLESARLKGLDRRLTKTEWVFGRAVGRSYVPVLEDSEAAVVGSEKYQVMVPITNPRTEARLVELACSIADHAEREAIVHAVHVVQAPEEMSLVASQNLDRITDTSDDLLADLQATADGYDVQFEASTVVSHQSLEEVFNVARHTTPDIVVMGWQEDQLWSAARAERPLTELANQLPCDFLIFKDRGLNFSRMLLPTAGGPDSSLGAEVAAALRAIHGGEISLLHVVDGPEARADGEAFLEEWAADHDLGDVNRIVDDSGDVEAAIEHAAEEHTMLIIGATERGVLARLMTDSLHFDVVNDIDCSVLLVERPSERSLRARLFGQGRSRD